MYILLTKNDMSDNFKTLDLEMAELRTKKESDDEFLYKQLTPKERRKAISDMLNFLMAKKLDVTNIAKLKNYDHEFYNAISSIIDEVEKLIEPSIRSVNKPTEQKLKELYNPSMGIDASPYLFDGEIIRDNPIFVSSVIPNISPSDYMFRILEHISPSIDTLIHSYIYLCNFKITEANFHRYFLISVLCAVKYCQDNFYNNDYFSKVGGISLNELNLLEHHFLIDLRYNLYVPHHIIYLISSILIKK